MKQIFKWFVGFGALSLIMIVSAGGFLLFHKGEGRISPVSKVYEEAPVAVVIDPGHGGEDGGCIGGDGTLEKELNLSVATKVYDILTLAGIKCELTRKDDIMLYDAYSDLNDYSGVKKTYDLKNRVRLAKESECTLFVSIHMNKFPISKYKGLQVYYSPNNDGSESIARLVKENNHLYLQKDNERDIKSAGTNIFILNRLEIPAVLIECGFLSNAEEAELLCDEVYRNKLALVIATSLIKYNAG